MNLTRFARTYAPTGEKKYWDDYWTIVNLRSGKLERPKTVHKRVISRNENTRKRDHEDD